MHTLVVRIQSRCITENTVNEERLEVLYSIRDSITRKFKSVVLTCGERMAVEWATGSSANE